MFEENLARIRAHRNNIHRYRRLLRTRICQIVNHVTQGLSGISRYHATFRTRRRCECQNWNANVAAQKSASLLPRVRHADF
jgi:hypothetical protein